MFINVVAMNGIKNEGFHRRNHSTKTYIMQFTIGGTEVVQLRESGPNPCNSEASHHYDQFIGEKLFSSQGCAPPYFTSFPLPRCWKKEQLKEIYSKAWKEISAPVRIQPCRDLKYVQYDMHDVDLDEASEPYFQIIMNYRGDSYKEITSVRAMDVQALIGKVAVKWF